MILRSRWSHLAVVVAVAALAASPARAQFGAVWHAERLPAGAEAGVFAAWNGRAADAFVVEIPAGWRLDAVSVLRGGYAPVDARLRALDDAASRYAVRLDRSAQGPHTVALRLTVGRLPGLAEVAVSAFSDGAPTARAVAPISVDAAEAHGEGQALAFAGGAPLVLDGVPPLGTGDAYTLAFWLRTTGLGEVVMSGWDGDEQQPYAVELVVGAGGELVAYRGRPGEHQSMTTGRPVADGAWHHVALVNDPESGATRLYLDGRAADSLRSARPFGVPAPRLLALGGRTKATGGPAAFTGRLDELRVWRGVRDIAALRRAMRQPQATRAGEDLVLSFDDRLPRRVVHRAGDASRVPSGLVLYAPVRHLRAETAADAVVLSWEMGDPNTAAFVVERSEGGDRFVPVGRVDVDDPARAHWAFRDAEAQGDVLFYRVRQVLASGEERVSATLKLGLGGVPPPATLVGNYPNPFRDATTIAYEVRTAGRIRLSVWDVAGVRVADLLDARREPGRYEHRFVAGDLPSGTYFVRLQTAEGTQTRTLVRQR